MLNIIDGDGALVIELDHGQVNTLDLELLVAVTDAFEQADPARPMVLTGAGRAFSAGVDLRRIIDSDPAYTMEFLTALSRCFLAVFDHPGPVVAAINGPAIAGGCVIAAACDLRVICNGPIGLAELGVGVPFPIVAMEIMRGVLGPRTAQLMLGAELLTPEQARVVGLVDEVTAPDVLLSRSVERARKLAHLSSGVFAHSKRQLQRPVRNRIAVSLTDDVEMSRLWASEEIRTAVAQYLTTLARPRA